MKKNNRFPKHYRLMTSLFSLSVLENETITSIPLAAQAKEAYQAGKEPKFSFTPQMAYQHNVSHYFRRIVGTIERIEQVPVFLRRFPSSAFYKENGITSYNWINYHYTNFLIMSISLYDISLLLTNEVFILGIDPRFCNERNVAKNKLVKATSVFNALNNIGQAIDEYRDQRHLFVHRGHSPNLGFMDDLETFEVLDETEKELGIKSALTSSDLPLSSPAIRQWFYGIERRKLVKQVMEKTDSYVSLLLELFDSLKPIYDAMIRQWTP